MNPDDLRHEEVTAFDRAYLLALDDHNEGVVRDLAEYLRLVPAEEQAELASLIGATLTPRTPIGAEAEEFAEGYARAMGAIDAVEASAGPTGILPGVLETVSRARGIEPDHVVAALAEEFDITSERGLGALRRQYHRLRTGQLLGSRISHRLLAAVALRHDADPEDFIAGVRPIGLGPRLAAAPAMPRPSGDNRRAASVAPVEPETPDADEELVNRLFCGGPDA